MRNYDKLERIAEVARLYYKEGKSQAEIGEILGVSHSTISRMLKEAHEHKIVEVFIRQPVKLLPNYSEQLETCFGLEKAYVISSSGYDHEENINNIALQAARILANILRDGISLGISAGRMITATIQQFYNTHPIHVQVVPLHGFKSNSPESGNNHVHLLAEYLGREFITLPAPWLMQTVEACQLILQEKSVSAALHIAENADVALVGIGAMNSGASNILRNDWISQDEVEGLKNAGAVGEICGIFYDRDGQPLDVNLNKRVVSISLKRLKDIEMVMGVANSENKAEAILAALRGGLIDVLVTDSGAARKILDLVDAER